MAVELCPQTGPFGSISDVISVNGEDNYSIWMSSSLDHTLSCPALFFNVVSGLYFVTIDFSCF